MLPALLLLPALLAAPSGALGAPAPVPAAAREAASAYREVLLRCPARLWPGVVWADLQFLFSRPGTHDAWLVGAKHAAGPLRVTKDQTLEDIFEPGFSRGLLDYRGLRTAAVSLEHDEQGDAAFRSAVHVLFRDQAQAEWDNPAYDDRGALFPLLSRPRYLRRMAAENLLAARATLARGLSPAADLAHAAYWLQRWKKEFPEELAFRTDTLLGTALYAEQVARLLAEAGCGARGPAWHDAFSVFVEPELRPVASDDAATEGALLGALAAHLLSELQPGWQKQMRGTVMTTDLLLGKVVPQPQDDDASLQEAYATIVGGQQGVAERHLAPELARLEDPSYLRVSMPRSWLKGDLNVGESYVLRSDKQFAWFFLDGTHELRGDYGRARLAPRTVLHQGPNPCGGSGLFFLVPETAVTASPASPHSQNFRGQLLRTSFSFRGVSRQWHGASWLCPWL